MRKHIQAHNVGFLAENYLGSNEVCKRDFKPGTRVVTTMGVRRTGEIIEPFFWKKSTDGTYKEPSRGDLPVKWDDGTIGYHYYHHMMPIKD